MDDFQEYQDRLYVQYRRKFIREVNSQDEDMLDSLIELQNNAKDAVLSNSRYGSVNEEKARLALDKVIIAGLASYLLLLKEHNTEVVSVQGGWAYEMLKPYEKPAWLERVANTTLDEIKAIQDRLQFRQFPADERTVGGRITTLEGSTLKSVRNILATEINKGTSAKEIAGAISNFIRKDDRKLWVSPYEWYRERFGFKQGTPKSILAGSLDYQAFRIARTEINYTWRNGTAKMHDGRPYLEGFDWVLSGSHPKVDVCDEWARQSPYLTRRDLPDGHPHCMCAVVPRLIDPTRLE